MQLSNELPNTLVFREIAQKVFDEFQVNVVQTYTDMDRAWRNGNPKYQPKRYVTYELEVTNELASKIAFEINCHLHCHGYGPSGANARIGKRNANRTYIRGTCIKSRIQKK